MIRESELPLPTHEQVCRVLSGLLYFFPPLAMAEGDVFVGELMGEVPRPWMDRDAKRRLLESMVELIQTAGTIAHLPGCEGCVRLGRFRLTFWRTWREQAAQGNCPPPEEGWPEGLDRLIELEKGQQAAIRELARGRPDDYLLGGLTRRGEIDEELGIYALLKD